MNSKSSLGYFLDYKIWKDACELENKKIEYMNNNMHFCTLNIDYFNRLGKNIRERVSNKIYFKNRIANNLFYGLGNEFFIEEYACPKKIYGIRNYKFISYSMNCIHNSIGLYILKISDDFIRNHYNKVKSISSEYGGNITYNDRQVSFSKNNLYYLKHHENYRKNLLESVDENKIVIKIDIQNYFNDMKIIKLLELLDYIAIKPSDKIKYKFDETTKKEIETFYKFIMKDEKGIPIIDNGIIANYIGHLFLCFLDLEINELMKDRGYSDYKIIRYMDDIHIVFKPKTLMIREDNNKSSWKESIEVLSKLKDIIYYKFGLYINSKTRVYLLWEQKEKVKFLEDSKYISFLGEYIQPLDIDKEKKNNNPHEKVDEIFEQLIKIKKGGIKLEYNSEEDINQDVLYNVFETSVSNLLNTHENKTKLKNIFNKFDFDLVKINPFILTVLVMINEDVKKIYIKFLMDKDIETSNDLIMYIEALRQDKFKNKNLLSKLYKCEDEYFKSITKRLQAININLEETEYFNLSFKDVEKILYGQLEYDFSIIKQTTLRVLNEQQEDFSIALNHLVNEFQSICCGIDKSEDKANYNATKVLKFLKEKKVNYQLCLKIGSMFDRRNNNLVSHSGDKVVTGFAVEKKEYIEFKEAVESCLKLLIVNT
ncbi:AbiA family abortive infection protein [Paeniclostridium sordellii]|uniref:AbiA family abortive infection protein n=1 Tax=Paraclostridium sordellii TaxID=1505 RepID=UPI0021499BBE|nr:AbiA family abortive infection protein [Paeniclostridium sordellii]MCR1847889.1 AbiA family abortive infection protein [Paeniclostridium sordellii]